MLHFGQTPGVVEVTSGCIGHTYVTPCEGAADAADADAVVEEVDVVGVAPPWSW